MWYLTSSAQAELIITRYSHLTPALDKYEGKRIALYLYKKDVSLYKSNFTGNSEKVNVVLFELSLAQVSQPLISNFSKVSNVVLFNLLFL